MAHTSSLGLTGKFFGKAVPSSLRSDTSGSQTSVSLIVPCHLAEEHFLEKFNDFVPAAGACSLAEYDWQLTAAAAAGYTINWHDAF